MRCGGQCFPARLEDLGGKRQSRLAGFATQAPCMGVVGVFERPFALDERLGFLSISELGSFLGMQTRLPD